MIKNPSPFQEPPRRETLLQKLTRRKPTVNPHKEFPKYENLLHQLCHRASEMYAIPYEECLRQAYLTFVTCCYLFEPKRGYKFITLLHMKVRWQLKSLQMNRSKDRLVTTELDDELTGAAPAAESPSLDIIRELSEDAQVLVKLLVDTPGELTEMAPLSARSLLKKVKDLLEEKRGWKKCRVKAAHHEVKNALQLAWAA